MSLDDYDSSAEWQYDQLLDEHRDMKRKVLESVFGHDELNRAIEELSLAKPKLDRHSAAYTINLSCPGCAMPLGFIFKMRDDVTRSANIMCSCGQQVSMTITGDKWDGNDG